MNIFFILPSIKNFLIILGILCRFEEINISITYSTKQKKFLIHILVYKKQFLQQVKILYFCLGWVEILMTPLEDSLKPGISGEITFLNLFLLRYA